MKDVKIYSPLSLDIDKDEPTFVNAEGVKWWLVSVGSHLNDMQNDPRDGAIYRVLRPDGHQAFLVLHNDQAILETENLEQALFKVDEMYLRRTK